MADKNTPAASKEAEESSNKRKLADEGEPTGGAFCGKLTR